MNLQERKPVLIVIAGPNGSGKTTITRRILHHEWMEDSVYINPDLVAQERFGDWNSPEAIRKAVGDHTHMEVELQHSVDPSILGGFSVVFDNNMYDARISSQVAKLRKEFSKNIYESKL